MNLLPVVMSLLAAAAPGAPLTEAPQDGAQATVLVVVGAEGTTEFGEQFRASAERWKAAAHEAGAACTILGLGYPRNEAESASETDDRQQLQDELAAAAKARAGPMWLVLIGHGTFDGKTARFNLRGPDVTSSELREWLIPINRTLVVCCCFSSSAPFLPELSAPGRIVISATRSGFEYNFSRFGEYLAGAIADSAGDLDKDGQTSILEAYLLASARLAEFYKSQARLASEHPLLDDNGDKLGTPADWFEGVKATRTAKDGAKPDGLAAVRLSLVPSRSEELLSPESRAERDELEGQLAVVRQHRSDLTEDEYFALIERLLVRLARLYEAAYSEAVDEEAAPPKAADAETQPNEASQNSAAAAPETTAGEVRP